MESSNILPSFFHEGNKEVDGHSDVLSELFLAEVNGTDRSTHAVDFLGLELDGLFKFVDFVDDLLTFNQVDGEPVHLDQDVAKEFGGLFADIIGGQEDVILLGPLFDFSSVLIESLESVDIDVGDFLSLCFFNVDSVGKDTDLSGGDLTLIFLWARLGSLTLPLNLLSGS